MHILLLGKNGQLGWELQRTFSPLGSIVAVDYPEIDLTKPDSIVTIIKEQQPQVIINATAYTAVDRAESEPTIARAVNGEAPGVIAELALKIGAALIHYSTDYVFDGTKGRSYTENDKPNPLSVYGKTKLLGEEAVSQIDGAYFTFRTSWVYSLRADSFVTKVLRWSREHKILRVASDQISKPTWGRMLAEITAILVSQSGNEITKWVRERRGIYHLAGEGQTSRLEWAKAILSFDPRPEEQKANHIHPAKTADFPTPAKRPLNSVLSCSHFQHTFGLSLPDWQQSLKLALDYQDRT